MINIIIQVTVDITLHYKYYNLPYLSSQLGVWRLLTVRYSERTHEMILMLCVSLKGVSTELWSNEQQILVEKLTNLKLNAVENGEIVPITLKGFQLQVILYDHLLIQLLQFIKSYVCVIFDIIIQVYDGLSVPLADHPVETLFGEDSIVEEMNGCRFKVSPQAFFQVIPYSSFYYEN